MNQLDGFLIRTVSDLKKLLAFQAGSIQILVELNCSCTNQIEEALNVDQI